MASNAVPVAATAKANFLSLISHVLVLREPAEREAGESWSILAPLRDRWWENTRNGADAQIRDHSAGVFGGVQFGSCTVCAWRQR
ncbi:hypothetical protein NCAST_32_10730 [Nocardia asteroides NBRC 15531]|uniref:Uncharacterized protein n=1 Tax=Nocardia asteroides NBRC 15531 TaxID=1110697 RepID=U5EJL1_NOCAS|nr:hypothetical protein NCAST_32_10730 [Nocardia asteroides NBRC 15531]